MRQQRIDSGVGDHLVSSRAKSEGIIDAHGGFQAKFIADFLGQDAVGEVEAGQQRLGQDHALGISDTS